MASFGDFEDIAKWYGFQRTTSSPHYPQGNGLAKRTVKTMKGLLGKSNDPAFALLIYRVTHFSWCGLSSVKLLIDKKLQTEPPQIKLQLTTKWTYLETFWHKNYQDELTDEL